MMEEKIKIDKRRRSAVSVPSAVMNNPMPQPFVSPQNGGKRGFCPQLSLAPSQFMVFNPLNT